MKTKVNGLLTAGLLVLLANGFILVHVARNRSATPVAEIELTDRELRLLGYGQDNSGVGLSLIYQNPSGYPYQYPGLTRKTYLALEYDGPAWQRWREQEEKKAASSSGRQRAADTVDQSSRLVLIEIGSDDDALRRKYPDTKKVLILPGASRGLDARAWARVEVPWIHVPLPASGALKGAGHYRVRLRQGPSMEIWVTDVQRIVG